MEDTCAKFVALAKIVVPVPLTLTRSTLFQADTSLRFIVPEYRRNKAQMASPCWKS